MLKGYTKGKRKWAFLTMMALLVVLALLMGCGPQGKGEVSPIESTPITDTKPESTSSDQQPSEWGKAAFEGRVYSVD